MYEFIKTRTGWRIVWGPPEKEERTAQSLSTLLARLQRVLPEIRRTRPNEPAPKAQTVQTN